MNSLEYIYPTDSFGKTIIVIQLSLFAIWFVFVVKQMIFLGKVRSQIKKCDNLSQLSDEVSFSPLSTESNALARFEEFCKEILLPEKSLVYSHIKTIFRAGFYQSNFDIQSLVRNTVANISGPNLSLRAVLSLFIVLGLLGTLFGLATSLGHLPNNLTGLPSGTADNTVLTNGALSEGFRIMLEKLGGAFTPSLLGVFLTILGVLIFSILQRRTNKIGLLLEKETLSNWVMYLYPTAPQHLSNQLKRSEQQLEENLEAAQKVAEFANDIRQDAEGLKGDIKEARTRFKDLRAASENLVKFSDAFSKSVQNFPGFQSELRELNKQMIKDSELLHVTIGNSLQRMNTGLVDVLNTVDAKLGEFLVPLQTNFNQSLEDNKNFLDSNHLFLSEVRTHFSAQNNFFNQQYSEQRNQLETLLQSLKNYEETYIFTRKSIDETLIKTLSAIESASQKLGQTNESVTRALVEAIGDPLKQEVTGTMQGIIQGMSDIPSDLSAIATKLGQINIPLERAAERMSAITEKFDNRTENFVGGLKTEFETQNQINSQYLQDLNTVNNNIALLNSNLQDLSEKLNNFNQNINRSVSSKNVTPVIRDEILPESANNHSQGRKGFYHKVTKFLRKYHG